MQTIVDYDVQLGRQYLSAALSAFSRGQTRPFCRVFHQSFGSSQQRLLFDRRVVVVVLCLIKSQQTTYWFLTYN
jgi:hypothetical protein